MKMMKMMMACLALLALAAATVLAMPIEDELARASSSEPIKMTLSKTAVNYMRRRQLKLGVTAEAFNITLGLRGVQYSAAAYCNNNTLPQWECGPCKNPGLPPLENVQIFYAKKTSTYGYVGIDRVNKFIVVAFQGSSNLQQWIDDLEFFKTDLHYPGAPSDVKVHSGFFHAYQEVKDVVDRFVSNAHLNNEHYPVLVTGHSLGAALATMCALDLALTFTDADVLHYTYGQPRVGNTAFFSYYKGAALQESFRFVHNRDIVPHLPLVAMGFHHIATEVFYKEKYEGPNSLKQCDGSGEDPTCSDQFYIDTSVSDHLHYLGHPTGC